MKRIVVLLSVVSVLTFAGLAHGEKDGILVDVKCGAEMSSDLEAAQNHPVSCALDSRASGYGIIADGKLYKFDDYGNKQAYLILKTSGKKAHVKVRVTGHVEGDLIKVGALETIE